MSDVSLWVVVRSLDGTGLVGASPKVGLATEFPASGQSVWASDVSLVSSAGG